MTDQQPHPDPVPEPSHVMTHAEWQRHLAVYSQRYTAKAEPESEQQ